MLTAKRLDNYLAFMQLPERIPSSLLLEAIQAVGGFYTGTRSAEALRALRNIVEFEAADDSTRVIAYIHMLEVGAIPIHEYPPNVTEINLAVARDGDVYKRLCSMAARI